MQTKNVLQIAKRFLLHGFALVVWASLLATSCSPDENPLDKLQRTVLIYMAGDNSLSAESYANIDGLKANFVPANGRILVYHDARDAAPRLFTIEKEGNTIVEKLIESYPEENSAAPAALNRVLLRMQELYPSEDYGLILWSHATGWLPKGMYNLSIQGRSALTGTEYPKVKTFGEDQGLEMALEDLATAIPYRLSFILFDACLMGGVEVAYALKDVTNHIIASPAEVLADGFPYELIMQPLFLPQPNLTAVCDAFYNLYNEMSGLYRSATVGLYATAGLPDLATVLKPVFAAHREAIAGLNLSGVQKYDRLSNPLFFDLDDFVKQLATPSEYTLFKTALDKVVVYKRATPNFITIPIEKYGGISTYIPRNTSATLNTAYKNTAWNKAVILVE
jgi:Clostripain family.